MSAHAASPPPAGMSAEEFLAWEGKQERKWEFDGFQPVAMVGGTIAHGAIQRNVLVSLGTRLKGKACQPFGSDTMVDVGNGKYRYPDALVVCTRLDFTERRIAEPTVLFEVLSDSTEHTDKTIKLVEYLNLPSTRRYVMLEQDQVLATVLARTEVGWSLELLRVGGLLAMPEIGVEIPMDELYDGVAFDAAS